MNREANSIAEGNRRGWLSLTVFGVVAGVCAFLPAAWAQSAAPRGEIHLTAKAIHPEWRTEAFPSRIELDVNPPSFFWPSRRQKFTEPLLKYDFELARDSSFAECVASAKDREPSFYVAESKLADGTWYWRYRESGKSWQGPFTFSIGKSSRLDGRPTANAFVEAVGGPRPRVLVRAERLAEVRERIAKAGALQRFLTDAEQYFDVVLPDKEWGGKFMKGGQRVFIPGKFPDEHVKSQPTAGTYNGAAEALCKAYLLSGDTRYGREAIRWAMRVASFDVMPETVTYDGNPTPDGFDFAFMLDAVGTTYDSTYDLMTPKERETLKANLAERLRFYYEYYCNRVENRVLDNHTWQLSLGCFLGGALTAKGDIPAADKYLAYIHDIWTACDPEQSRTDGGWHGGGYVGVNIGVWKSVPAYFRAYTGYNYYQHPFYTNQPGWFFYRQPPGSVGDGFSGDGYEGDPRGVARDVGDWLRILDTDLDLPLARWLASTAPRRSTEDYAIAWTRFVEGLPVSSGKPAAPPRDVPQAKAFRDTGIVNIHRDILNPKNDLFVSLRSGPYGVFGHNLANHNAFTVLYQGEPLFVPFRYRFGGTQYSVECYRHTRGHNSVLIDGKGQPYSTEAYGWIPRFLHADRITYACGDASHAYTGTPSPQWYGTVKAAGSVWEKQMGDDSLKRFRRHLLFLRPSLVVVYDELEADRDVRWDWLLHCRTNMVADGTVLRVGGMNATANIRANVPLGIEIKTAPHIQPVNVDGRGGNNPPVYASKGSFACVTPKQPCRALRVLALLQVGEEHAITEMPDGALQCGEWILKTEMDPAQPANLVVWNADKSASFTLKTADTGESVLSDLVNGNAAVQRAADEVPFAARGLAQESR